MPHETIMCVSLCNNVQYNNKQHFIMYTIIEHHQNMRVINKTLLSTT